MVVYQKLTDRPVTFICINNCLLLTNFLVEFYRFLKANKEVLVSDFWEKSLKHVLWCRNMLNVELQAMIKFKPLLTFMLSMIYLTQYLYQWVFKRFTKISRYLDG